MKSFKIAVAAIFSPYVEQAIARLSYLHADANFTREPNAILVELPDASPLSAREVTYQLYREKIYQESLPMRQLMYSVLLS